MCPQNRNQGQQLQELPEVWPPLPVQPTRLENVRHCPSHTGSGTILLLKPRPGWEYHLKYLRGHSQILLQRRKPPNPRIAEVRGTHMTGPENGRDLLKDTGSVE